VDIDVLDLCVKLVVLLRDNTNSLLVVAPDRRCTVEREINASEETHSIFHLRGSEGEGE
jgi:hypothetical protein